MKTENLEWVEAIKAYAVGKRIKAVDGDEYWLDGETPMYKGYSVSSQPEVHDTAELSPSIGPFSIVVPEEKSLTAFEALQLSRFAVHVPDQPVQVFSQHYAWEPYEILLAHLAAAQGWKITEVEE